jgi:hypothetical protein
MLTQVSGHDGFRSVFVLGMDHAGDEVVAPVVGWLQ